MRLLSLIAFLTLTSSSALTPLLDESYHEIKSDSEFGKRLLSSARALEAGNYDISFMADYSIRYQGCHHMITFNNNGDGGDDEGVLLTRKQFARFRLCPANKCSRRGAGCSSNYGDYVVDLYTFLDAYIESKERSRRSICENASWDCGCDKDARDDDGEVDDGFEFNCEYSCYKNKRLSDCLQELEREQYERTYGRNENEFRLEEYAKECRQYENGNNQRDRELAADDYYKSYYIGPYCAKQGGNVYLGMFTDDTCTNFADNNHGAEEYKTLTGNTLPYKSTSIINNDCVSCIEQKRNGEQNDDDSIEISNGCQQMYQIAGKCETRMNLDYPVENACTFVAGLSTLDEKGTPGRRRANTVIAFTFIFAGTTIAMGAYAYVLRSKQNKSITL